MLIICVHSALYTGTYIYDIHAEFLPYLLFPGGVGLKEGLSYSLGHLPLGLSKTYPQEP